MPPLGPPFAPPDAPPPPPRFPNVPPEQWPTASLPAWEQPASAPPPPPSEPSTLTPALIAALVTFIVVLVGAFAYSQTGGEGTALPRRTTTTSTDAFASSESSSAATTTTAPLQLNAVIEDIKAFVEQERGLQFTSDVPVNLVGEQQFNERLFATFEETLPQLEESGQVLHALGLLDKGSDIVADMRTLLAAGVGGFYDPETKELVVRGTATTPFVRQILAHELTHALDDQHFTLHRPELDTADDETGFGFTALVEGDARRVEDAYFASLSTEDQQAAEQERLDLLAQHPELQRLPQVLLLLLQVPYSEGERFVLRVLAEGQTRLDTTFGAPPTTSEQVLDPDKFLAGEGPIAVAPPEPGSGAPALNRGVLGSVMFAVLFDAAGTSASPAVEDWGGDQYVTWTDGARTCVRDVVVGDDAVATAHLGEALALWARTAGNGATVEQDGSGSLVITSCQ
jgi:hypothetical protein